MKTKLLLWLLLLCAGRAWAQLPVTESFETDGEGTHYTSTTTVNTVSSTRYFIRSTNPVAGFGNPAGSVTLGNMDGSYLWACEGVRGTSINSTSTTTPGTLTLNPINNTQSYTNLQVTVAFADPRSGGINIQPTDHLRVQYRYGATGAFTMLGEFTGSGNGPWTRSGGSSPTNTTTLTSTFSDHTFSIPAGTGALYVQIEADYYGSNKEIGFDNIRVTGTASAVPKPTITSNVGTSTLTFAEGTTTPLTVFSDLAVANPAMTSNPTLAGATVSIAMGYAGAEDVLTYTIPGGSGISLSSNTGQTLTFSGQSSVSNYEALLESVKYQDTDPNNATAGDRKLSFVVKSTVDSAPLERIITVTTALNGASPLPYAENFDTDGEGTRYGSNTRVANSNGFVRLMNASNGSATPGSGFVNGTTTTFTNVQGPGYWYTNGTQGVIAGNVGRLTLAPVNAAGFTNLHFKVRVGATNGGLTSTEFLRFSYSTDGGTTWTVFANYAGDGTSLRLDGSAANPALTTALINPDFTLPTTLNGATISFRAETNDGGGEQIVFDDIQITGMQQATVTSIVRASTNATNAATVNYTVTFNTAVTGLTASNFSLTTTGSVSGASVGTPVAGTGTTWTVPVNTGTGSGTLTLNLANDTNLSADVTTTLPFAGETYTIDKTAPTVAISSTTAASGSTSSAATFAYTVTFSESVTGFVAGDVTVGNGTLAGFSGSGTTYTFTVTPSTNGAVTVNIAANVAVDAVGNGNTAASQYSITYSAPTATVVSVTRLTSSPTATAQVQYRVVFSSSVTNLTVNNFATANSGTTVTGSNVSSVVGSGTTYTVTANTGTGDGTLRLDVVNSTGTSPTISNVPYTAGEVYTITKSFAAAPTLRIQAAGSASGNGDVTAFVDVVQVLQSGTSTVVPNGLQNGSFETNNVPANGFKKTADGVVAAPWSFTGTSGVARYGSLFDSQVAGQTQPLPPNGDAVALIQSAGNNNASISQNLAVPTGSYQVSFQTIQRYYTAVDQRLNVFVNDGINDVFVGNIQPNNIPTYQTFTSAAFNVFAPSLTATVSTTSASPTSTAPIPFSVSFTQSVGTTFTASDVTVAGGTVTSGSFSGSGAGPYTFTVTPSGGGIVSVSLAAGVANDANNTQNSASNILSVQFQAPTIVVGPAALANGQQGTAYSQTLSASGGTAPYTFAITAGALPAGLSLNLSNGTIAGTPTTNGSFTFTVTATDASAAPGPYSGSRSYSLVISTQPVTAAPVVTAPANGSLTNTTTPTYQGTAPAGSTVTVYVDGASIGVTTAPGGSWSLVQPTALAQGSHTVYATAQTSGLAVSANSNTNTFTVDSVRPSVAISSSAGASGSSTSTSPIPYTVTFSENVTGFVAGDVSVTGGTLSGFTAVSGATYTFNMTPSTPGTVTVNIPANVAVDRANNGNTAASQYSLTFVAPTITVGPASLPNGTQNTAYSQTLSASGGTAPYSYSITAGALPAGLNLSNGTIAGTPTANGTFTFTVTATDASAAPGPYSGSRSYSLVIAAPAVTTVTWTGNTSTDWFTASNWSPNQVPDATIDAVIPTSPSGNRFPVITSTTAMANVRNLTLNSGSTLTQRDGTLNIAANLTNNGTFQPTGGTVVLGNSTLSSILGAGNVRFWNLTVGSSGAQQSTSASTSVQRLFTLNGNFRTNGNPFTLESNASGTAMVVNNDGNVVSGNATVQRYIDPSLNPNRGYRHFSSPIGTATVGSLATGGFSPIVNPNYNTSAQPSTVTPFPTVYGYDQARLATTTNNLPAFDKGWFSPSALSNPLAVGQGYTVNLAANQTFSLTGPLNNGNVALSLARNSGATAADAGLALVGNPYPSPLDWSQVDVASRPGLDGVIFVFQSNDPTNPYAGSYSFFNNNIGNISPVLPLGQGFFVRVSNDQNSATLTFKNSHRPTTYSNNAYRRTAAETRPLVQLTLKGAGSAVSDDAFVYFEQGSTEGFDPQYDAVKLPNPNGLNLSASVAGQQFSINGLPGLGSVQRVIPLAVGVPAAGSYSFWAAQLLNLDATPVYLRDLQLGTLTDLRLTPSYQFTVTNASALITGRFELVFSPQKALATVPAALAQQVALYPNPAKKAAFVELPASLGRQAVTATFVDALGRQLRTVLLPAQGALAHQLDLTELATGVYALRLSTSAGVVVKKLVVE
ncbi:MAG: putative Ig domain-containing protein [Janthinobacterium lividum]